MAVLQKVRLISNERLDLPDFLNLDNFACADWAAYFEKFISSSSQIISGFEILNPSPLIGSSNTEITVVIADSVMFHPTAANVKCGFYVAASSEANQTVSLTPNAINYIEFDQIEETGAPDIRKIWDPSANGNEGAEFSQIVDTVTFLKVELSSNTIGFTEGKIPIAKVVVNNGSPPIITAITDCRPLLFRLGSGGANPNPLNNYSFVDSPTGYARTDVPVTTTNSSDPNPFRGSDKNLKNQKDWMDAVMTIIKEIRGVPHWLSTGGSVSGLTLPKLWFDAYGSVMTGTGLFQHSGGAATGTITVGNITILDGETFTIDDGVNTPVVFEFDNNGSVGGGNTPVTIGAASVTILNTVDEFKDAIIAAINGVGAGLAITATDSGTGVVGLVNDEAGPQGNATITETVANAGFVVTGMAGGDDVGTLTWTSDIYVRSIIGNYFFRLPAGSIQLSDDEVAYVTQIRDVNLPAGASLTWADGKDYVNGVLGSFAGLSIGDFIKKQSDGIDKYVRIADFKNAANGAGSSTTAANALSATLEIVLCVSGAAGDWQVGDTVTDGAAETCEIVAVLKDTTLDSNDVRVVVDTFSDIDLFGASSALTTTSGGTGTFSRLVGEYDGVNETADGFYAKSQYTITKQKREAVPNSADTWWLAFRDDNGSNIARIFIGRSGAELEEGEEIGISDQPPVALLNFIGSTSDSDSTPNYNTQALGSKNSNTSYNTVNGENLTVRASKLTSMMADKAQDKNIEMLMGSVVFTWNLATETLSWDSTITLQIPSSTDDNTIAAGSAVLNAGEVAYVSINRNSPSALSVVVSAKDAVPLDENTFVWARRDGDDVLIGSSFKLRPTDEALGEYTDHLRNERICKPIITQAAPDTSVHIYPAQRLSGSKRKYVYFSGTQVSKFPRDGSGAYDGGVNDTSLTEIDFDPLTTPGSIEVGVTFPSIARAVIGSVSTPAIGEFIAVMMQINRDDSVSVVFGAPQATLGDATDEDNLPVSSAGSYPVAIAILEVTGATAIANITESRLLDMRPTGIAIPEDTSTIEYDKHQDALTENGFQEIYIDVFNNSSNVDSTNTVNMVTDVVSKAYTAGENGTVITYDADVLGVSPDAATDVWVANGDATLDSIVSGRLRINDNTAANFLNFSRTESSTLALDKGIFDFHVNMRVHVGGTGALEAGFTIQDQSISINVGVIESVGIYSIGFVDNARTSFLTSNQKALDLTANYDFRIVKIGDRAVQLFAGTELIDVLDYASFPVAVTPGQISFGTYDTTAQVELSFGKVEYRLYTAVLATNDIARKQTIQLDGDVLPESATPAWTKTGGATSALVDGTIQMTDASAVDFVNYSISGATAKLDSDGRNKRFVFTSMFQLMAYTASEGTYDEVSYIRVQDGSKDIIVAIGHDGTDHTISLVTNTTFNALVTGTTQIDITSILGGFSWFDRHSIRIEKDADNKVYVFVDRELMIEANWSDLPNTTSSGVYFGTGDATGDAAIATVQWDNVMLGLPGEADPIELGVVDFLGSMTTDDPLPILLYSSDGGSTWAVGKNDEVAGLDYTNAANTGGEIYFMAGLIAEDSVIDDYSVMYTMQRSTGSGYFKYFEYEAVGGETTINLPFSYSQGNYELEVVENGVELYVGALRDYVETSPTSITLNTPAVLGDKYKFRVNHRIIFDNDTHLDGNPSKHDASEIDVEGTYTNIPGTPTDLESTIAAIDTLLGGGGGATRLQIHDISGGVNPPSSGAVGSSLGFFQALKFAAASDEDIYFQFPIPENCDITQDIVVRLHYSMGTSNGGDVKLNLNYIVANSVGDDVDPVAVTGSDTDTFTPGTGAETKKMHSTLAIDAADISSVDAIVSCQLQREGSNVADTHTGTFDLIMIEIDYTGS